MLIAYELKNVKYRKSTIDVSDNFLQNKVVPLIKDVAARQGSPKDQFIAVNKTLRKVNEDKITEVTKQGDAADALEGRLRAAQQLEGRGELRGLPHLHLQRASWPTTPITWATTSRSPRTTLSKRRTPARSRSPGRWASTAMR